jgi:hypothetical protein
MIRPTRHQLNMATIDPDTVTKKEYQDICGIDFDDQTLEQRLQRTSFLYPKHVEVIEDLSPIADEMVNNIVSLKLAHLTAYSHDDTPVASIVDFLFRRCVFV